MSIAPSSKYEQLISSPTSAFSLDVQSLRARFEVGMPHLKGLEEGLPPGRTRTNTLTCDFTIAKCCGTKRSRPYGVRKASRVEKDQVGSVPFLSVRENLSPVPMSKLHAAEMLLAKIRSTWSRASVLLGSPGSSYFQLVRRQYRQISHVSSHGEVQQSHTVLGVNTRQRKRIRLIQTLFY